MCSKSLQNRPKRLFVLWRNVHHEKCLTAVRHASDTRLSFAREIWNSRSCVDQRVHSSGTWSLLYWCTSSNVWLQLAGYICSTVSQTFFRAGTSYNNCSYPEEPLPVITRKRKYKQTVVSARRLLQNFQLSDKHFRHISRCIYNFCGIFK